MNNIVGGKSGTDMKITEKIETNHARVSFDARSMNEGFARMVVMGFMMDMNPTMDELQDVKTAVSEAVTNAIIHGYGVESTAMEGGIDECIELENVKSSQVEMTCMRRGKELIIEVVDYGIGIENVEEARQPFFTTKPDMERSGMGFAFMETFMDKVEVCSKVGQGTRVIMTKYIDSEHPDMENGDISQCDLTLNHDKESSGK